MRTHSSEFSAGRSWVCVKATATESAPWACESTAAASGVRVTESASGSRDSNSKRLPGKTLGTPAVEVRAAAAAVAHAEEVAA